MEVYMDNAATTRVYPEVVQLMNKIMEEDYGNPSSLHMKGVEAERYIRRAREILAGILKVEEKELIFTSGGTESNNLAIIGGALANQRAGTSDHDPDRTCVCVSADDVFGTDGL